MAALGHMLTIALIFSLLCLFQSAGAQSPIVTTEQSLYVISVIAIIYIILTAVLLIVLFGFCCCYKRNGRVCPSSQDRKQLSTSRKGYTDVKIPLTSQSKDRTHHNLHSPTTKDISQAEESLDFPDNSNLAYQEPSEGESSSSTSTDNDKKNIIKRNSKRERGDSFVLRNKSFTEDDDDFPEGLKEPEDEDTSMTFI